MLKFRQVCYRLRERKGQTMTEYALLPAGIAVAAVAGIIMIMVVGITSIGALAV